MPRPAPTEISRLEAPRGVIPMQPLELVDSACVRPESLADRVRQGDSASVEELRRLVSRGVGCLAARELPASQVEGCVREVLDRVISGIQSGDLEDPVRLLQYVRLHLAARVREIWDKEMRMGDASSLTRAADARRKIMRDVLLGLTPGERQSMVRFYVQGHDDRRIWRELHMPAAEFQSLRARVKARFQELCQKVGAGCRTPAKRHRGLRSLASGRAAPV